MVKAQRQESEGREVGQVTWFEISSRFVSVGESRFDATAYAREAYAALSVLERSGLELARLADRVARVYHPTENQPRSNFKRIWADRGQGPPFLTGRQLLFFRPDKKKFLSPRVKKIDELMLRPSTILLSRSGTTGVPVILGEWLSQFAITDDALRVFPSEAPAGFVYAYLASGFGRALMGRHEYGATVSHLEAKHVLEIPIPRLNHHEKEIHDLVMEATRIKDEANYALDEVQTDLFAALGVSDFDDSDVEYLGGAKLPHAFSISVDELGDRFDATFHVPVTRSVVHKLGRGKYKLRPLGEVVDEVYLAPRFARVYVQSEFGVPFLQGSQLPQVYPQGLKHISITATRRLKQWLLRPGWVLVTRSGTIGRIAVTTSSQDGWAGSEHIIRVVPRDGVSHGGFIGAFLMTAYGQLQLTSRIYGGVVDELTEEDTASVLVPDVPFDVQQEIGERVRAAFEARDLAASLERKAIDKVERLIRGPSPARQLKLV